MSSSLWDSRFDLSSDIQNAIASVNIPKDDAFKISSILAAAGRRLIDIHPTELQFHRHLGAGSCFKVECELYTKNIQNPLPELVAVKYLRIPKKQGLVAKRLFDGVKRELRVLTHPPFRNHECVIEVLGYGWSTSPDWGAHPYLVVDYSDHGTLSQYLRRITPSVDQCRNLALDVAVGLQALHGSEIIHGDLKPDNILVFDCDGERPQVAKLADFGASIFDADFEDGPVSYRGTARYNAPELEGRLHSQSGGTAQTKEAFLKADIYSLGLVVWEAMNNGDEYCEPDWLVESETALQLLDRIWKDEKDGLLARALSFCEQRFRELDQPIIEQAITDTFKSTLTDDPSSRGPIEVVVEKLARGVR